MYSVTKHEGNSLTDSVSLVERVLPYIGNARVAVLGDYCVDHYLFVAEDDGEISLETGLKTRPIRRVQTTPGGAGNVVNNLTALGVGTVEAIGVVGDDMYGRELARMLEDGGAHTDGLLVQADDWDTNVYTKVYDSDEEDPRLDIGSYNALSAEVRASLLEHVERALSEADVLIVNQQIQDALYTPEFLSELTRMLEAASGVEILVDSRDYADAFNGTVRKINLDEARHYAAAAGLEPGAGDPAELGSAAQRAADIEKLCIALSRAWETPIIVTRGEDGCLVAHSEGVETVPGIAMPRPVDPVGAGDALLAGTAASRAVEVPLSDAARVGNICAAVTVKKLFRTGTAAPQEVRALARRPAFRLRPDLAHAPEQARYLDRSRLEIVTSVPRAQRFRYAIFDHDGTVSVLRQGWEPVMQDVMVEAICGVLNADTEARRQPGAGEGPYSGRSPDCPCEEVEQAVSALISDTTGIQTIEQMHLLRDLVGSFGLVGESEILSAEEYKRIYLQRLDRMIARRAELVRGGLLDTADVTLKGAVSMLQALSERGVELFLASGSDHDAVEAEAELLGYAGLFEGRIFGSVGDAENDPKTVVLTEILNTIGSGAAREVVTFGDGPVEIRETARRGGTAVGVASDEVRRYGLNRSKRTRLILAGADLIVPDFAEREVLLDALFGGG